jgi:hypothetical protein
MALYVTECSYVPCFCLDFQCGVWPAVCLYLSHLFCSAFWIMEHLEKLPLSNRLSAAKDSVL